MTDIDPDKLTAANIARVAVQSRRGITGKVNDADLMQAQAILDYLVPFNGKHVDDPAITHVHLDSADAFDSLPRHYREAISDRVGSSLSCYEHSEDGDGVPDLIRDLLDEGWTYTGIITKRP